MESVDPKLGHSVTKGFGGKARVSTGRVCLAFEQDRGRNETCRRRGVENGNPASGEIGRAMLLRCT